MAIWVNSAGIVSASERLPSVLCWHLIGGKLVAVETHCTGVQLEWLLRYLKTVQVYYSS